MSCASPSPDNNANRAVPRAHIGGFFRHVLSSFDFALLDDELPGRGVETGEAPPEATTAFQHAAAEFSETKMTWSFPNDHRWRSFLSGGACSLNAGDSSVNTALDGHDGPQQCHVNIATIEVGTCGPQLDAVDNPPVEHRRRLVTPHLLKLPPSGKQRVYQWKPQADQELEKKRQRAIKAHRNREKGNQRELDMRAEIASLDEVIAGLQGDVCALKQRIAVISRQLCALTSEQ